MGISWPAEGLLASQEGLCCVQLVSWRMRKLAVSSQSSCSDLELAPPGNEERDLKMAVSSESSCSELELAPPGNEVRDLKIWPRRYWQHWTLTRSQDCKKRLLAPSCLSVCLSIRLHGTTRLPLISFSWNLVFEYSSKNLQRNFKFHSNK